MPSDTENVKIGVCSISYKGTDLGYTKGGVEVEVTTDTHEVMVDQFGNTPISEYLMGRKIVVRAPLAETTLDNLVATMPGAVLVTDATTPTKKRVDVKTGVGTNLQALAGELVLHPIGLPTTDKSEDLIIPLAATAGAMRFAYKLDDERIFNVEFKGYPSAEGKLYSLGDSTATP